MKRYIALLACVLALGACGNQSDASNDASNAQSGDGSDATAAANSGQVGGQDSDQSSEQAGSSDDAAASDSDQSSENKDSDQSSDNQFASDKDKRSYALGMDIGNSLTELPVDINMDQLTQGVRDVVEDNDTRLTEDELDGVMQQFVKEMKASQKQKASQEAEKNAAKGRTFLAKNKKKDGVKTTDSGLEYKVIEKGDGSSPDADDSVTVHYTGKLLDGTVFDSSRKRGKPVTFPVNAVIPGWTEALQLMKQGAEYKLFVPADLAYGERGAGAQIGPNQTLIFDVELLKVDKKKAGEDESAGSANARESQAGSQSTQGTSGQGSMDDQQGQSTSGEGQSMSGQDQSSGQMSQADSGQPSESSNAGDNSVDPSGSSAAPSAQDEPDTPQSNQSSSAASDANSPDAMSQ